MKTFRVVTDKATHTVKVYDYSSEQQTLFWAHCTGIGASNDYPTYTEAIMALMTTKGELTLGIHEE